MNKNGFTIIELIVTISIIVLMAVLAFPAFSKYQKKAELVQKAEELNGFINEMNVLVKNPEPGVDSYEMIIDPIDTIKTINFKKNYLNKPSESLRDIEYNSPNLLIETDGFTTTSILCSVENSYCCLKNETKNICKYATPNTNIYKIIFKDSDVSINPSIEIKDYPFSARLNTNNN